MTTPAVPSPEAIRDYVGARLADRVLVDRVTHVLVQLPDDVLTDLLHDPAFSIRLDVVENRRRIVHVDLATDGPWRGSRLVVLKPHLSSTPVEFAHWVIAHELAHAFLWNGGWGEITDREHAADALAAHWGFPKPRWMPW